MKKKNRAGLLAAPMIIWSLIFVGATIAYIVAISFMQRNPAGNGVVFRFTLENYAKLMQPAYAKVFVKTLRMALDTTLLCILVGYPFALLMARAGGRMKKLLLLLVIVPFWTNALVRIYGWRLLMMGNGPINNMLMAIGLIDTPIKMMNTRGAVLLGMVYGLIPFMILPVYSSAEKMDRSLIAAGRDLGAKPWKVFLTVELPLTLPGLLSGCVLVFVPSMALFFISDLLGGTGDILVGNLVRDQLLKSRDWPFAAALSVLLLVVTGIVMLAQRRAGGKSSDMTLF
ncbi:MAG: ABC transporter permease [Akkermansia sp.]|nr:ABC transporter permease [Akkermansia sp.]